MHYGVKGMKWGVRKQYPTSSRSPSSSGIRPRRKGKTNAQRIYERLVGRKEKNKEQSEKRVDKKTSTKPRSRPKVSEMSDEDLRKAINRMEMERKYTQLTTKEISKGRKFVNEVLYNSAKSTATTYTTKAMGKLVDKLLDSRHRSGSS